MKEETSFSTRASLGRIAAIGTLLAFCFALASSQPTVPACSPSPTCDSVITQIYTVCGQTTFATRCSAACQQAIAAFFLNYNCGLSDYYYPNAIPALSNPRMIPILNGCQYGIQRLFNPSVDPGLVFDSMWEQFYYHYPLFCNKGVDWFQIYRTFRAQINETLPADQLWNIMTQVLGTLDEAHAVLLQFDASQTIVQLFQGGEVPPVSITKFSWHDQNDRNYLSQVNTAINGVLYYSTIRMYPQIGFVRINSFAGFQASDWARAWDTILNALARQSSLIIDVRYASRGDDMAAAAVVGRFTDRAFVGLRRKARIPTEFTGCCKFTYSPLQTLCVAPVTANYLNKEVVVLTSAATMGAAEVFVMMMRHTPACRVTVIGETTQGAPSYVVPYTLPNGWVGMVPYMRYYDAQGNSPDGVGQIPDVVASLQPDRLSQGVDNILDSAINYLINPAACQSCVVRATELVVPARR